ncbi:hypothetical protein MUK71_15695 [Arthrobacter zhangbolii]|uniref:Uncharacterized protein n=1 Tax=Arthrobacter zhangbolii TaxID=2886936 RepID=A0A9X1M6X0_9MICC|nr:MULTISPECIES: hypothetical protein [Arthrobacter]MCC3272131.1 hypothetical protein [Arthrobacter zhangbolii]MCC3294394.1 hypothetical protein [Arthrobacter zhangbolii]MDN3903184.1 hypothetical protein [Arthrobacter sp. YD2]UON91995.1 hypothetical protein MUK71_15695 [Arthrobacter zhangbolii]
MAYTPQKPALTPSSEELRARIPGWGADLDPKDRPAVPKLQFDPTLSGAHWEFPERQEEKYPRERSMEHKFLTPVFGTSCPPKGLSGVMRRYAYSRYSEARAAHWLILLAADRVDAVESHLASFVSLRPDNPVTETGVLSEFSRHGYASRAGRKRADTNHQWIDPLLVGGPWLLAGAGLATAIGAAARRLRK